ncbi:MAG: maleylpyruvate isomerase family mycothiol-dependent enzyme, partial [Mycobacteriales bacterium]
MAADVWPTIHAEREALIADLEALRPEQWEAATTCGHWNVHQVFGHLVSLAYMSPPKFFAQMAGAGFNFGKYAEKGVAQATANGPAASLKAMKAAKGRTSAPPGPKATWLGEHFVHGEDIRRALGIKREYPLDQVERALVFYAGSEPIIHGKSRVAGLTLKATDVDVTIGTGPIVEGPVLSLLIAASGRK